MAPDPEDDTPPTERAAPLVAVLDHGGEDLGLLAAALERAGFVVRTADSLAASVRLLGQVRPDVVLLAPLVLTAGGVEAELLEKLQRPDDPVPAILLVDGPAALSPARQLKLPLRDFLLKPYAPAEALHRVELALLHRQRIRTLQEKAHRLEGQVSVDHKTGLLSELYFQRLYALEFKRAQRHHNPLSLLLIDVDDFKGVNDATEYAFGDEVLKHVGQLLKSTVRETDFAARCGGDEFCVLLPQSTPAEAVQTALRLRQRISGTTVEASGYSRAVTVSIGIDTFDGRSPGTPELLKRNANKALQEAKRRGKNQVWLYADQQAEVAGA